MLGCAEFCGYYDWTFEYLRRLAGEEAVAEYWLEAISRDSQRHAYELIKSKGFAGMDEYWGHTLGEEEAGYVALLGDACGHLGVLPHADEIGK